MQIARPPLLMLTHPDAFRVRVSFNGLGETLGIPSFAFSCLQASCLVNGCRCHLLHRHRSAQDGIRIRKRAAGKYSEECRTHAIARAQYGERDPPPPPSFPLMLARLLLAHPRPRPAPLDPSPPPVSVRHLPLHLLLPVRPQSASSSPHPHPPPQPARQKQTKALANPAA